MKFNLPKLPDKHRWYLARHSPHYACLKAQKKEWWGWYTVAQELVCITERQFPIDVAMRSAADDVIRIMNPVEVKYGEIS